MSSQNVLICDGDVVKLCDFGSSHEYIRATLMSFAGTASWMAPEVIRNEPVSDRADVFSFGVVMWEMITREIPFHGFDPATVIWQVASHRRRLCIPSSCPAPFAKLIEACWMEKPSDRPSMTEIFATLKSFQKEKRLCEETNTFIGNKNIWKIEIEKVMENLKSLEGEMYKREVCRRSSLSALSLSFTDPFFFSFSDRLR